MIAAFFRTIILYTGLVICLRIMGKRQIGQLQPTELVVMILISELASIPMEDTELPLYYGIVPIITLLACEMLMSTVCRRSIKMRQWISGKPSILIMNGVINQKELARLRVSVAELLEELRLKDVFDISDVACAYLETNGQISVLLKPEAQTVSAKQMSIDTSDQAFCYTTVIAHGRLLRSNLISCGKNEDWLDKQLKMNKLKSAEDVFLMVIDNKDGVVLIPKSNSEPYPAEKEG